MGKFITHIIIVIVCVFSQIQIINAQSNDKVEYLRILNYTPKNYQIPSNEDIETKISISGLDSIWKFKTAFQGKNQLTEAEINWLKKEINQLALEFFLEDQPIILEEVGGYIGCPDQLLKKEIVGNITITTI